MRTRSRHAVLAALGVAALVAAVNTAVLVGGTRRPVEGPIDCALVLGAGVAEDGAPSWVLHDRLAEALALYQAGRVRTILVSGDHGRREYDEPNAMRAWLEARGVPPSAIFMDHAGFDTYSSVWRAKHVFGASRVVVVTQRFHLPRALWVARSLGIEAEGAAADRRLYRGAVWFEAREVLSRTKAFVDVAGGRKPRHAGPPISLDQDGRVTAG
ncbi:MAG: YdcF family protein [Labilithrix sp.]|nr:YdcF family protein [Labilithrix sp.]